MRFMKQKNKISKRKDLAFPLLLLLAIALIVGLSFLVSNFLGDSGSIQAPGPNLQPSTLSSLPA